MKLKEALPLEKADFKKRMELRRKKGADYGKDEQGDVLSNFKEMAQLIETLKLDLTKPHGVAMFFVLHKITRIVNLWNKGTAPQNESLRDSFIDLSNYVDLSKECYFDWREDQFIGVFKHLHEKLRGNKHGI